VRGYRVVHNETVGALQRTVDTARGTAHGPALSANSLGLVLHNEWRTRHVNIIG
jgi:hypothetical protein